MYHCTDVGYYSKFEKEILAEFYTTQYDTVNLTGHN